MAPELVDIYDENKNKTGKVVERKSDTKISQNEYFLAVECWIINNKNEILLTQRAWNKKNGGKWECNGGLPVSGENSLEGIKRELKEEIGLTVENTDIKLVKTFKETLYPEKLNRFHDIYLIKKDIQIDELTFSDREVINAKYVTLEEFNSMLTNGKIVERLRYLNDIWNTII